MRWREKEKEKIVIHNFEERIITKFAFFPIALFTADGKKETRWLEIVKIKQRYLRSLWCDWGWDNVCFID